MKATERYLPRFDPETDYYHETQRLQGLLDVFADEWYAQVSVLRRDIRMLWRFAGLGWLVAIAVIVLALMT